MNSLASFSALTRASSSSPTRSTAASAAFWTMPSTWPTSNACWPSSWSGPTLTWFSVQSVSAACTFCFTSGEV